MIRHCTASASASFWICDHVAFFRRRAHQRPEHRPVDRLQGRQRPVQPAVDGRARLRTLRIDRRILAVGEAEIAHHRIGFPQHEIAVDQRRHAAIGIHREIRRFVVLAELHAGIDAVIGEIEFAQAPQHFLNIDRIGPAPDGELLLLVVSHAFSLRDFLAVIFLQPVHSGRSAKKRGLRAARTKQKIRLRRVTTEPDFTYACRQRPKNNHNRMITGIGTPNSHNKIPRPILVSSKISIEERTCGRDRLFLRARPKLRARCRVMLWNLGERQSDSKQRVAVSIDGFAHFGVDVAGLAAARQPPFVFGRARGKRHVRACHQPVAGMADVHEANSTRPTSGRCSASRSTARPAASDRPSATARSNADPASGRTPCCRRAAGG